MCLIIPCYNEATRLDLEAYHTALENQPNLYLYFVDDGSTDQTSEKIHIFESTHPQRVRLLSLAVNQGKGEAIRQGVLAANSWKKFSLIGYFDADLSTPLTEIPQMVTVYQALEEAKLLFGTRVIGEKSRIKRSKFRHFLGKSFAFVVGLMLGIPVSDTQCGAKIFSSDLDALFLTPFQSKWLFDIELAFRLFSVNDSKRDWIAEFPLSEWKEHGNSRLTWFDFARAPFELLSIFFKYKFSK